MDRRIALKNMGLALGYTVATPTLLNLVQGCKTVDTVDWTPDFFTKDQGNVLYKLVDIILPKTDTPSA
ncbi:MAG: gluconate 2-dehydrogenase subunit 3 family protein, partial [Eudoraea sp.]|nr:gluconate 2-dehydrogenase subunit 3 family protein [Eudoraea sp.]